MDWEKGRLGRGRKKRKKPLNSSTEACLRITAKAKPPVLSTAGGLLSMLKEKHPIIKLHALNNLNIFMERFWPEISANIAQIEALYEDEHSEHRHLVALVASKVFYHLGELTDSLAYALGAGSLFNISDNSEYAQTLVAKCVDEYISMNLRLEKGEVGLSLDPRLVAVVDRVLDQCLLDDKYEQTVGIALECRRLDKLEEAITRSQNPGARLTYCLKLSQTFVNCREFRCEVLRLLVANYQKLQEPDYVSVCQCLMLLDEPQQVSKILQDLVQGEVPSVLLAYQVAFDLFENENQRFLERVKEFLQAPGSQIPDDLNMDNNVNRVSPRPQIAPSQERAESMDIDKSNLSADNLRQRHPDAVNLASTSRENLVFAHASGWLSEVEHPAAEPSSKVKGLFSERLNKLKGILTGDIPINLHLHFLHTYNRFDDHSQHSPVLK